MDLVITQLTDLHIKSENDLDLLVGRTNSIVGAISEVIRKPEITILIICVTGDIAYSGSSEQYAIAELFFDDIYEKLKNRYENMYIQYMFVPGNHDCNFNDEINNARSILVNTDQVNVNDMGTMRICTAIQNYFFEFVDLFVKKEMAFPINRENIFTENIFINKELSKFRIKLHCFNTAWCSSISETNNMKFFVPENIENKDQNDIIITLMHHGNNWFKWESADAWEKYYRKYSDIILVGHDHKFQFVYTTNYDSTTNYVIKGNQLYSEVETEQSGFNIFKVNLEDNMEFFYTYSWKNNLYERIIETKAQPFIRNKFEEVKVNIVKELYEYLEKIEIDIVSKYKAPLLMSDLFFFPVLQGERLDKPDKMKTYRSQEEVLTMIQKKKKIVFNGGKEFGKTALLKRLFLLYFETGLLPILLSGEEIVSVDEAEINNLVRNKYATSYNNINVDETMQLNKEHRVCLIDDFDSILISDKSQKLFLEYINNQFDIVIISYNEKNCMMSTVKNLETNEFISINYYILEIVALRRYGKSKLIEKWLLLENPMQDVSSQEFDAKKKAKDTQMQSIIKNSYFSNTPIEFLLVLSYIDNAETINADYSRYSYIYDSLIRDRINEIADKDTKMCSAYRTLLEMLAYDLYKNGQKSLFVDKYIITAINNYNEDYPSFRINTTRIIQKLINGKIIEERNDKYKFKYNYMYYYFAGSYIVDILSPEEKDEKIEEILSNLSVEINYNIALFIAYSMSTEYVVLPKVQKICNEFLKEHTNFKYEDQKELISNLDTDILKKLNKKFKIPENSQIPGIQEQIRIANDELDELNEVEADEDETEESKEETRENIDVIFNDFTKLLRLIQFQGEVLKNYATKIKNSPRYDMIDLMGVSNIKLVGFLFNMISKETDKIIEIVEKKAVADNEERKINKDNLIQLIRNYIGVLWTQFIEISITNLAMCWECDVIQEDILKYKENVQSAFFDMVYIEYRFRITDSKLPIKEIENCLSGNRKLDAVSLEIIKHIIAGYLSTYQYDAIEKEKVCNLFGFDYSKLFIEDKKNQALGITE